MRKTLKAYFVSKTDVKGFEIVKEIDINEKKLFIVEVPIEGFVADDSHDEDFYVCFQNKQWIKFNPLEYAYIESTSNHYSNWYPIDPTKPMLSIYTTSLGAILKKLQDANFTCFCRVHSSFIINKSCIRSIMNNKILLEKYSNPITIGKGYKKNFLSGIMYF